MSEQKLLIIDGNSLLNRAYYAIPPLNSHDGTNVNAVFGFLNIFFKALGEIKPTHVAVAFDKKGKNFRHELYEGYKATRKGMPDDLAQQMPVLFDLLDKMSIKRLGESGVEADDVIGSLSKSCPFRTVIVTGDRDLLQLIDNTTSVMLTKKGITDVEEVTSDNIKSVYGTSADNVVDFKALKGDPSDNIPGVAGIGDKIAVNLIDKYGTIENIYADVENIKGTVQAKLLAGKDMAFLSKTLATIKTDVDVHCTLEDLVFDHISSAVKGDLERLEFRSLFKKLAEFCAEDDAVSFEEEKCKNIKIEDMGSLNQALVELSSANRLALFVGQNIWLAKETDAQFEVAIANDLFGGITFDAAVKALKPLFESDTPKIVYDGKEMRHLLAPFGVRLSVVQHDVSIMQYLVEYRSFKNFDQLKQAYGLTSQACALISLSQTLFKKLEENNLVHLYEDIELPLSNLLFEMEESGFKVDVAMLDELGEKYKREIDSLAAQAYDLAGEKFNIQSTKQLGHILFEKLGLPAGKKTKTGYSTENDILEKIKDKHPIVGVIQQYRKNFKLLSTYIDGFRPLVSADNLIHTKFNQTLTATGRLSSSEPNLQNLPVREEEGKEIRKMFVPTKDMLISADYSQIELRLLAHFSGDENLIRAFNNNIDIHATVAAEILGIPIEMVTPTMRRTAKAVNFGIIYGISEYGLAQNVGISPANAKQYIAKYFDSYPAIRAYLDGSVEFARKHGYVETITGRRRQMPEISSSNYQLRSFGERAAMNMPLQGSAADIIKVAMINVDRRLKKENLQSKIILQIHDELVLDVVASEEEAIKKILHEEMTQHFDLKVKLDINVSSGKNLYETK